MGLCRHRSRGGGILFGVVLATVDAQYEASSASHGQYTRQVLIRNTINPSSVQATIGTLSGPVSGVHRDGYNDGPPEQAKYRNPAGIVVSPSGDTFVADARNHVIRRVYESGWAETFAGRAGAFGLVDGRGGRARFYNPSGIAIGPNRELYVADTSNHAVRRIARNGEVVTLFAGRSYVTAEFRSHALGSGAMTSSSSPPPVLGLWNPQGIACWPSEQQGEPPSLVVADTDNHRLLLLSAPAYPPPASFDDMATITTVEAGRRLQLATTSATADNATAPMPPATPLEPPTPPAVPPPPAAPSPPSEPPMPPATPPMPPQAPPSPATPPQPPNIPPPPMEPLPPFGPPSDLVPSPPIAPPLPPPPLGTLVDVTEPWQLRLLAGGVVRDELDGAAEFLDGGATSYAAFRYPRGIALCKTTRTVVVGESARLRHLAADEEGETTPRPTRRLSEGAPPTATARRRCRRCRHRRRCRRSRRSIRGRASTSPMRRRPSSSRRRRRRRRRRPM